VKRFILVILFLLSLGVANAQWFSIPNLTTFDDRRIHFGFTLGLNTLDMKFQHYNTIYDNPLFTPGIIDTLKNDVIKAEINAVGGVLRADIASLTPGFTVGIVSNLRLTEKLDLRFIPGLSFGSRKIVYNVPVHDANRPGNNSTYQAGAVYLDFPVMVKYKSKRIINHRPYTIGGLALRYDISKADNDELLHMKKTTFSLEAGMGWDLYLQFFRLSTELKYSFGLGNNLSAALPNFPQNPQYHLALKRLTSNVITLSFHFE
jgi:hypothetical protein